jgi:hypothetical protein
MVIDYSRDATEEWRQVVGHEGIYEISTSGKVRRIKACRGARAGRILRIHIGAGNPDSELRYATVHLFKEGTRSTHYIHHLVAFAFLGPRPDGKDINHKDGNKSHNSVANLEYLTAGDNTRHAIATGLSDPVKAARSLSTLSESDVHDIRVLLKSHSGRAIARMYGVQPPCISRINTGKRWRSLR